MIDGAISTAASGAGFTFADVRGQFTGHELCSGDDWLHAVDIADIGDSYHPTATGHVLRLPAGVHVGGRSALAPLTRRS